MALLTDLYQLTMAHGYWKLGRAEHEAVFHLFFRKNPFRGGYTIAAGLEQALAFLDELRFDASDLAYLRGLVGNDDRPLFEPGFLDYLGEMRFSCDVDGIPEGTAVFPHEALLRVRGPILQAQIIETPLLNMINFSTLIATKAARICAAARGEPVLEFGLRRAQGVDGALSASRAAYIGGCAATSNCLAGKLYDIPVKGTHAHSWVMSFDDELESFAAYARAMPNNCVFLVDTYDTLRGVEKAIELGRWLREQGHEMVGIRLDSGDLGALSQGARALLDEAGFPDASVVASNDLDEYRIATLKERGAKINVWGVGTRLATAYDQPALGGVYKLAAIRGADPRAPWSYRLKLSEQAIKVSNPGPQQVHRFSRDGIALGDLIYDIERGPGREGQTLGGSEEPLSFAEDCAVEDLLVPLVRDGARVYQSPPLSDIRARTATQLATLAPELHQLRDPATYPVGLERRLQTLKDELIAHVRAPE
jgi:nicotinate phosphoribosyltransferase